MNRKEKRQLKSEFDSIIKKAKRDMETWISLIDEEPTVKEMRAWQSGYIYGLNRAENGR